MTRQPMPVELHEERGMTGGRGMPRETDPDPVTPTQQRTVTGTAAGAGIGAIGGNAGLGAAAGLLGGLLFDHSGQVQDRDGFVAGQQRR